MNNKPFLLFLLLLISCTDKVIKMNNTNQINIIPKPRTLKTTPDVLDLLLVKDIVLENNSAEELEIANLFKDYLKPIINLNIEKDASFKNAIYLKLNPRSKLQKEGYLLEINKNGNIYVEARSQSGLFYAFQSFRQLCSTDLEKKKATKESTIPICKIEDFPTFSYRGMHLDVSRHFFDVDFIKTYIDMIALHKMNVFHWHLTDDNGWRIEIKKYPELTEKSAWRVDRTHQPWKEQSPIKEHEKPTYGGFYTQEEIREVVNYAAKQNITIIPEIEMPGHTSEVFAAYPELSCKGDTLPVQPGSYWPTVDIFCAGNDSVFNFLENVLSEVFDLSPPNISI